MKKFGEDFTRQNPPLHPHPRKKQVRRRVHTTKPYQERAIDMAEARREIVSALKLHRAAMKAAREHHRNSNQYPSSATPYYSYPFSLFHSLPQSNEFSLFPSSSPSLPSSENLDFALPERTLGLNLNFSDFDDLDYTLFHNNNFPCSSISSSTPSSSSSPNLSSATTDQDVDTSDPIHSIGETNQALKSGRWVKFLNGEENGCHPFEEAMEIPDWLHSNESFLLDHLNHHSSQEFFEEDNPLPCMDIGDIEGVDDEWLKHLRHLR